MTDLASYYEMSLNGVSKHLKVLESAGLVERKTIGREHWINANLRNVDLIEKWFAELKSIWLLSLDQLENKIGNKNE